MPTCPNCSHRWTESRCSECRVTISEAEAVVHGDKRLCLTCAAGAIGRRQREAERPRMPDPELEPRAWERAHRARARGLPS